MVTTDNWTYCHYKLADNRAMIFIGAEPASNLNDIQELYFATVIDETGKELFQKTFTKLSDSLEFLNNRYKNWSFVDGNIELNKKKSDGCSNCQAH